MSRLAIDIILALLNAQNVNMLLRCDMHLNS